MIKRIGSKIFLSVLFHWFSLKMAFYRILNRRKKKILIYTDSRGHEITRVMNKANPFSGFSSYFIKHYCADVFIVPEKHTTIYDFLLFMAKQRKEYDIVIAHVGVVCFSPRPNNSALETLNSKQVVIESLFGATCYQEVLTSPAYEVEYLGESTKSLLPEFMLSKVAIEFNKIKNLIWISCNPILNDWDGGYKKRPLNVNMVKDKSVQLISLLDIAGTVDLTNWDREQIMSNTCDNVHLTDAGMKYIKNELKLKVNELLNEH